MRAAAERAALLAEKRTIFARNDDVIRAVLGPADGSVLALACAWARIGRNVLSMPHRYALRHAGVALPLLLALLVAAFAAAALLLLQPPHATPDVRA